MRFLLLLMLISCAQVSVKNTEWCADAGVLGATCVNTLSEDKRDIGPMEWEEERFGRLCGKSEDFTALLTSALQACRVCKCCTFEVKKKLKSIKLKLEGLQ